MMMFIDFEKQKESPLFTVIADAMLRNT